MKHLKILSKAIILILFVSCHQDTIDNPNKEVKIDSLSGILKEKAARIDSFFLEKYGCKNFNGVVLFAENGKAFYKKAFGYKNLRTQEPLNLHSTFQLASVTKPFTSTAILMLYEKGLLQISDPIQKYIPAFPYDSIIIEHLLTHYSGLPNYMYFSDKLWGNRDSTISNDDILCLMENHRPDPYYLPHHRYNYCNTNYALLAAIIEIVSGMDYDHFMQKNIFEPLEMNHTTVYDLNKDFCIPNKATGHNRYNRPVVNTYLNGVVGDKGIYACMEDLLKFDQALYTEKLLSNSTLKKSYKRAHKRLRKNDNYGYGWRITMNAKGHKVVYHTGWWRGFKAYFIRILKEKKTIIVLTNTIKRGPIRLSDLLELAK